MDIKSNQTPSTRQEPTTPFKVNPIKIACIFFIGIYIIALAIGIHFSEKHTEAEKSYFEYTEEDVKLLGDLMYAEVSLYDEIGISLDGEEDEDVKNVYMLIGSIVLHRLESRRWGETMKEVIYAPGQYSVALRGDLINIDTPKEVYEWAEELLKHGPEGPEDLIFESCFKQGSDKYWEFNGIYFSRLEGITQKVEGGKVN